MPRLFSAFRISQEAEDWLSGLELEMYGARWINREDYHVTIRFFGDVDRHAASDIAAGLSAARQVSFTTAVTGLACYGGDRPRNLVASIEAGSALDDLHRTHERVALTAGLQPERRKYLPHVTIARLEGTRPETIARFLQSFTKAALPRFDVGEVVLFSSRPGSGGGPYVAEETFNLTRGAAGTTSAESR
jgi:2'-5' RNA ligase